MNDIDWESRWSGGDTPWDTGGPTSELVHLLASGTVPEGRALVPGCGSGYDVLALAGAGWSTLGLEIAPSAVERFRRLRDEAGLVAEVADVALADYFAFEPDRPFDLMWDYTFLCAIDPHRRPAWAERAAELLRAGGELVTLIFPVAEPPGLREPELNPAAESAAEPGLGPPFPLDPHEVRDLLAPWFVERSLSPATRSHPRRAGREWLGRWERR